MFSTIERFELNLKDEPRSEAELSLGKVRALRDEIVTAWQERAVVLSKYEQELLHQEIVKTCELLLAMTRTR